MLNKFLIVLVCFLGFNLNGQWNKDIWVGTSLTFIPDPVTINKPGQPPMEVLYREYTWNLNASISLNEKWRVGAQHLLIRGTTDNVTVKANLLGVFGQYNLVSASKKNRLFIEGDLAYGNYCTCGDSFPYKRNGLTYWGWGVGYNRSLSKNLVLEIGINAYYNLQSVPDKYSYTQYVVGLEYRIFKAERKAVELPSRF